MDMKRRIDQQLVSMDTSATRNISGPFLIDFMV